MFSSAIEENWLLGTLIIVRSGVRMRVERSPICMTVPVRSPKRQTSPTETGRSPITEIPPNRFSIVFCAARATTSPPTPRPARIVDVLYPHTLRTLRSRHRAQDYRADGHDWCAGGSVSGTLGHHLALPADDLGVSECPVGRRDLCWLAL